MFLHGRTLCINITHARLCLLNLPHFVRHFIMTLLWQSCRVTIYGEHITIAISIPCGVLTVFDMLVFALADILPACQ